MTHPAGTQESNGQHAHHESPLERLAHDIDHAAHYLPTQGPIAVFVHHNTLHSFESMPFEEAVRKGAEAYGCQPYYSEERYHQLFSAGRITIDDIRTELSADLQDGGSVSLAPKSTRFDLRLAMLKYR